jgi:hypothetical protein
MNDRYDPFGFNEVVVRPEKPPLEVKLEDFRAYMKKEGACIFIPSGEIWPSDNVNKRLPPVFVGFDDEGKPKYIPAATWLYRNRPVEQMTWAPGEPELIRDRLFVEAGWLNYPRATVFNLYRPPTVKLGDPAKAERWVNHVEYIYPDGAERIVAFFAHAVQKPFEKVNHAKLLGGDPGVGKDSALAPVRESVGSWNFADVTPKKMFATRFNGYLRSVVLRISEAHDLGDTHRNTFYEHLKDITASPPEALRIDEKNIPEYYVVNVCHVVITTNHRLDALYLPAEDRRFDVCWSPRTQADFDPDYWPELWRWYYKEGGFGHVAAYLFAFDLSDFDPKAPPPKTEAFWSIVNASRAPEDAELADLIDKLGEDETDECGKPVNDMDGKPKRIPPVAVTVKNVIAVAGEDFEKWLTDRKNSRQISHRFVACGYMPVRSPYAKDGQWRVAGSRRTIYVLATLSPAGQFVAAEALAADRDGKALTRSKFNQIGKQHRERR